MLNIKIEQSCYTISDKMCDSKVIDVLTIGYGCVFFPFLNCTDLDELRITCKEIYEICKKASAYVTFYGLPLPTNGLFYNLFYGKYAALEQQLKKNEDFYIVSRYRSLHGDPGPIHTLRKGDTKYNYMCNGMVPLEIAYMLKDAVAINILLRYGRSTAYRLHSYSSQYKFQYIILLSTYHEDQIKKTLLELRPVNWRVIE
jgi:hypothetical protein